ncbi:MAG: hypothetical protein ACE15B_09460 [Bryobacteraceae bacterium]
MTKIVVPVVIAMIGVLACSTASYGKAEYTKQTKKPCATCHVDAKKTPKDLTEAGKYFKEKKTLDGYEKK